jgi:hypothetical protein
MKRIPFQAIRWLLIIGLVLVGITAIPQAIEAGTPGNEAIFEISNLVISPAEADTGQSITISATIRETNNISGIYEGTLRIDGAVEETKALTVGPEVTTKITFTVSKNEAGVYSVNLDGLTGSFTVTGETTTEPADSSFPTASVVGGIVAAVVVVGLILFFLNKRKTA